MDAQRDMRIALSKSTPRLTFLFKLSNNNKNLHTDLSLKKLGFNLPIF
jgi:hypothetical protein